MNAQVLIGVAGIAGTVAVSWISNHTTRQVERYRQSRELDADRALARGAARLIDADLSEADGLIELALAQDAWWPPDQHIRFDAWTARRGDLAAALPEEAWDAVADCYTQLTILEQYRKESPQWDDVAVSTVSDVEEAVNGARRALSAYRKGAKGGQ